jgi:hypothetical protein
LKLYNQKVLRVIAQHDAHESSLYRRLPLRSAAPIERGAVRYGQREHRLPPDLWLNAEKERESQRQPTYHGWYDDITRDDGDACDWVVRKYPVSA